MAKRYQIKYRYRTGNSFHKEDCEDILEFEWDREELAVKALKRIQEHYRWYESIEKFYMDALPEPKWHKKKVVDNDEYINSQCILLEMDNGEEVMFYCPWCGYFETLYGAEIVNTSKTHSFTL